MPHRTGSGRGWNGAVLGIGLSCGLRRSFYGAPGEWDAVVGGGPTRAVGHRGQAFGERGPETAAKEDAFCHGRHRKHGKRSRELEIGRAADRLSLGAFLGVETWPGRREIVSQEGGPGTIPLGNPKTLGGGVLPIWSKRAGGTRRRILTQRRRGGNITPTASRSGFCAVAQAKNDSFALEMLGRRRGIVRHTIPASGRPNSTGAVPGRQNVAHVPSV